MRVAIFGTGYVGLVTGTCLADVGHQVVCVDIDQAKVDGLNRGIIPIYEPGLEPMVKANHAASRLVFTTDAATAIGHGQVVFIAVGTPPDEDGSADLQYVLAVARTIGRYISVPTVVVNKSTVPVGTADKVRAAIAEELAARGADIAFDVVSNPEFLKEGDAVADCMRPDRIIIGATSAESVAVMRRLYAPFNRNHDRVVEMDVDVDMVMLPSLLGSPRATDGFVRCGRVPVELDRDEPQGSPAMRNWKQPEAEEAFWQSPPRSSLGGLSGNDSNASNCFH